MEIDEAALSLIESIYEAAADASRWGNVLAAMQPVFGTAAVLFWRRAPSANDGGLLCAVGVPEPESEGLARTRPFDRLRCEEARLLPGDVEEFEALVPFGDALLSEFADTWRERHDLAHGLAVAVLRDVDHLSTLELVRARGSAPFGAEECDTARLLVPHLARAVLMERARGIAHVRSQAAAALGDRLPVGVLLVGANGEVVDSNRRARSLLDRRDGLSIDSGLLRARQPADTSRLHRCIRAVAADEDPRSVTIEPSSERPIVAHVAPIPSEDPDACAPAEHVLVYLADSGQPVRASADALRKIYGLTPKEAEVTTLLGVGYSHLDVADELGVSICAVRYHLKSIYTKTGTQRQSELVHRLLTNIADVFTQA